MYLWIIKYIEFYFIFKVFIRVKVGGILGKLLFLEIFSVKFLRFFILGGRLRRLFVVNNNNIKVFYKFF